MDKGNTINLIHVLSHFYFMYAEINPRTGRTLNYEAQLDEQLKQSETQEEEWNKIINNPNNREVIMDVFRQASEPFTVGQKIAKFEDNIYEKKIPKKDEPRWKKWKMFGQEFKVDTRDDWEIIGTRFANWYHNKTTTNQRSKAYDTLLGFIPWLYGAQYIEGINSLYNIFKYGRSHQVSYTHVGDNAHLFNTIKYLSKKGKQKFKNVKHNFNKRWWRFRQKQFSEYKNTKELHDWNFVKWMNTKRFHKFAKYYGKWWWNKKIRRRKYTIYNDTPASIWDYHKWWQKQQAIRDNEHQKKWNERMKMKQRDERKRKQWERRQGARDANEIRRILHDPTLREKSYLVKDAWDNFRRSGEGNRYNGDFKKWANTQYRVYSPWSRGDIGILGNYWALHKKKLQNWDFNKPWAQEHSRMDAIHRKIYAAYAKNYNNLPPYSFSEGGTWYDKRPNIAKYIF
ncbi:hypothetical protein [Peromfec virus RodF7_22]|uniref:Uncharacterized protein n=1 Tax=Peromfec virus RodF7_22 TaxID=2929270 RepID=A0A976N2T6_9VIRU|nr:hypothetical protein [Peromfec virus RodF7_22]